MELEGLRVNKERLNGEHNYVSIYVMKIAYCAELLKLTEKRIELLESEFKSL